MKLLQGDCFEVMQNLEDNSVDLVLTDPPYGLKFMGKKWDYDVPPTHVWYECLRVLKPGGHALAFAGTRTQHRMACRIEDAGFEIRDCIMWHYSSGFPKSHNGPHGGTALKPATEIITMARKSLVGTVATNFAEYGTGALNIDACRVGTETIEYKNGCGGGKNSVNRMMGGNIENDAGFRQKPWCVTGRWPANLIHDGSDEVLGLLPNNSDRFFYCAKASKRERDAGCEGMAARMSMRYGEKAQGPLPQQTPSKPVSQKNHHPTVKPIALMEYLVKLASSEGQTILDPFMGSGTTGIACQNLNRRFIGIEMNEEYFEIARNRINNAVVETLF